MGLTIESPNYRAECGCGGFYELRQKIADLASPEIGEIYCRFADGLRLPEEKQKAFYEAYDRDLDSLAERLREDPVRSKVLYFLYRPNNQGQAGVQTCRAIWEVIKDYDDGHLYGWSGRSDCMTFSDFKHIVQDCVETKTPMLWD